MGYYPSVFVRKKDLETNASKIFQGTMHPDEDTQKAYQALEDASTYDVIVFPELEIVCVNNDDMDNLTSRNKDVRDLLEDLDIEYAITN